MRKPKQRNADIADVKAGVRPIKDEGNSKPSPNGARDVVRTNLPSIVTAGPAKSPVRILRDGRLAPITPLWFDLYPCPRCKEREQFPPTYYVTKEAHAYFICRFCKFRYTSTVLELRVIRLKRKLAEMGIRTRDL